MWSDNDIDNAFRRLDPPEPEPTPFPLDAWLQLESRLDEAVIARAVRRRLWQFFAAEVAAVLLVGLGWYFWPAGSPVREQPATAHAGRAADAPGRRLATPPATVASAVPATPTAAAPVQSGHSTMPPAKLEPRPAAGAPAVATAAPAAAAGASPAASPNTTSAAGVVISRPQAAAEGSKLSGRASLTGAVAATSLPRARLAGARAARALEALARREAALASRLAASREAGAVGTRAPAGPGAAAAAAPAAERPRPAAHQLASSTGPARGLLLTRPAVGRLAHAATTGGRAAEVASPHGEASEAAVAAAASYAPGGRPESGGAAGARKEVPAPSNDVAPVGPGPAVTEPIRPVADIETMHPVAEPALQARSAGLVSTAAALPATLTAGAPLAGLPRPPRWPRWYVGLVAAPEATMVRFAGMEAPGYNLGLTLDYRLGPRLRLSTGLLRASKSYVANRDDYDWGANKWRVYGRDFEDVEGACTVLDVPLNLRYDLLVRPAYRLVGSVGVSSFLMQRESYYYDWTDATGPHTWGRSTVNENRHWLRILNLGVGAEYGFGAGGRWSLLAEPYAKVPLAGVGAGRLKLLSGGIYLGLKYGL